MTPVKLEKKSKYKNIRNTVDGINFASKAESGFYGVLKMRQMAGEVAYFLRQVPIHLPGGVKYVVDFLVAEIDPKDPLGNFRMRYIDVKGFETREFKTKRSIIEALYPIKIETVKRA